MPEQPRLEALQARALRTGPRYRYSNLHLPAARREEHPKATAQALYVSPEGGQPHVPAALELGEIRLGYPAPGSEVHLSETKLLANLSDQGILRRELTDVVDGNPASGTVPLAR